MSVLELFKDLKRIVARIPSDLGGGCPLSKSFLMARLALELDLKNYVEIGVYRGRSFFPMAHASKRLGGMAIGIDAYDCEAASEQDLDHDLGERVNRFLRTLDFGRLHAEVNDLRDALGFGATTEIIKERSSVAADILARRKVSVDMLHIDGNHDTRHVLEDVDLYLPLVRDGGLVVLDDTDLPSVRPALNRLKAKLETVFDNGRFAVFAKPVPGKRLSLPERQRFEILYRMVENLEAPPARAATVVSVVLLCYNQEKYVAECLEGILGQQGEFHLELVVGDDASTDGTRDVIGAYLEHFQGGRVDVKVLGSDTNVGVSRNVKRCLEACTGEYIAFCEGDDYWIDSQKLQLQAAFLASHPECSMCFNDIHVLAQETGTFSAFALQEGLDRDAFTTRELVRDYFIGNLSCCMYDARYVRELPARLFDLFIGDWMLNLYYSRFGDIGHVRRRMSVYRKHAEGLWSEAPQAKRASLLHGYIDDYNRFLDYEFDAEFSRYQRRLEAGHPAEFHERQWDVAILDDVFPHPLSAFRTQEFEDYFRAFGNIKVFTAGQSIHLLGKATLAELIAGFKRRHPEHAGRVEVLRPDTVIKAKLIYLVFLGNAFENIERIEERGLPFVFTLYPGGCFGLNNARSDGMLRRVTSSPCFRRVIVTQKATYDYLVAKGFCRPDQIELIFGLVTPVEQIEREYTGKKHFGIDKEGLDVCFVAHKYTVRGLDKGYDVFVEVARELSRRHENVRFHVVGGFDETDIEVTDFRSRIAFYGLRDMEWFDQFYRDKDIILSPNVPSMVYEGSFDGFPTGTCVDAAARKTAVFAADALGLNTHFVDREDIVIIPHDAAAVTEIVEDYWRNPERLKALAESGSRKVKRLYSYEAQMAPRIAILKREVERAAAVKTEEKAEEMTEEVSAEAVPARWDPPPDPTPGRGVRLHTRVALWVGVRLWKVFKRVRPARLVWLYRKVRELDARPR